MGKGVKIVISLAFAVIVAGGYAFYVNASGSPDGYVTVAATDIQHGETIEATHLKRVAVQGATHVQSIAIEGAVNKTATREIDAGEVITDRMVADSYDEDERLYTIDTTYTGANGPVVKPGMEVEVWSEAEGGRSARQITTATVYTIKGPSEEMKPGDNISVTLQVHQNTIEPLEDARSQAALFLVVKGEDVS